MRKICKIPKTTDLWFSVDGSREPNKIPHGNKLRRLEAVVEARPTLQKLDDTLTKLLGA